MHVSSEVRIEGVETLNYLDHLRDKERVTEQADAITFESEVTYFALNRSTFGLGFIPNYGGHNYSIFFGLGGQGVRTNPDKDSNIGSREKENNRTTERWAFRCK